MKKTLLKTGQLLAAVLMLLTGILMIGKPVQAAGDRYYASVGPVTQTEWATNAATVTWKLDYESSNNTMKTAGYYVYLGENYQDYTLVGKTSATSYRLTGLTDGKEYYVRVEPYGEDGTAGNYSRATIETMPAQVKNFRQDVWWFFIKKLDVKWDPIKTADKITVSLFNSKGKQVGKTQVLSGYSTNASFSNMKDEVYTVKIQAFRTAGGKTWQTSISSIQCFNQARITSARVSKKKLTVKWGKVRGATGYDIYVSTRPKSGYKKVKSVKGSVSKVTLPKFKGKSFNPKKKYYIYVETKKKNGKKINRSGGLYFWNSKDTSYGYLN